MRDFSISPIAIICLVVICALAVFSNYRVSINLDEGFRFEPAQSKSQDSKRLAPGTGA